MKKLALGAVLVFALVAVAAGCGGGGGDKLTKEEYASQLNAICTEANQTFSKATDFASFKENGDDVVAAAEKAVGEFEDLNPPDELQSASGTFNDSSDEILEDLKNANEAAQNDDQEAFNAAGASLQGHSAENDDAAKEIGATECVGGS